MTIKRVFYDSCGDKHKISSFQADDIHRLLELWVEYGPVGFGEFDFMTLIAERRGWHPLTIGETMNVTIGDKCYSITRKEDRE